MMVGVFGWPREIKAILQAALHHGDDATKAAAVDLVHRLGAKGHSQYRDLVAEKAAEKRSELFVYHARRRDA